LLFQEVSVNQPKEPQAGEKMTEADAKAYVDYLYNTLIRHGMKRFTRDRS
jgi:hypothetical protein